MMHDLCQQENYMKINKGALLPLLCYNICRKTLLLVKIR